MIKLNSIIILALSSILVSQSAIAGKNFKEACAPVDKKIILTADVKINEYYSNYNLNNASEMVNVSGKEIKGQLFIDKDLKYVSEIARLAYLNEIPISVCVDTSNMAVPKLKGVMLEKK